MSEDLLHKELEKAFYHIYLNHYKEAEKICMAILSRDKAYFQAYHTLSIIAQRENNIPLAQSYLSQAFQIKPHHATLFITQSEIYREQSNLNLAIKMAFISVVLDPTHPECLACLASMKFHQEKFEKAYRCYRRAILIFPAHAEYHYNTAVTLSRLGKRELEEKEMLLDIILDPSKSLSYFNYGIFQRSHLLPYDGLVSTQRSVWIDPYNYQSLNNLGNFYQAAENLDEAISCFRRVIRLKPDFVDVHCNMSLALLSRGDFLEGWREYEWRLKTIHMASLNLSSHIPRWLGEFGNGRTILILAEQGFGDSLHFCRLISDVAQRGWKVIFAVPPFLMKLMEKVEGVSEVTNIEKNFPACDVYSPLLSLPMIFKLTWETLPPFKPYLFSDPQHSKKWAMRLKKEQKDRFKVGLVWCGNPREFKLDYKVADQRRSLQPDSLGPLLAIEGIDFYSLQKTGSKPPDHFKLINYMPEMNDFYDTAAFVSNLDLVITVDTAMLHLCAGMGVNTWMLDRLNCCWRWERNQEHTAWYPHLKIFRQKKLGEWSDVIDRVVLALREEVRNKTRSLS